MRNHAGERGWEEQKEHPAKIENAAKEVQSHTQTMTKAQARSQKQNLVS